MNKKDRMILKLYVKTRDDYQKMRITIDNRIGLKADGSTQNIDERIIEGVEYENLKAIAEQIKRQEKEIEKFLKQKLDTISFYRDWLSKIDGIGPVIGGWILSIIEIEKAPAVSNLWSYSGLSPGLKLGLKRVKVEKFNESMGRILSKVKTQKGTYYTIETDTLVRGDRLTKGFLSPFNKELKMILVGRLATSFLRSKSRYRKYYDDRKERQKNSEKIIVNDCIACDKKDDGKIWKDVKDGHRDKDARRIMIKKFLQDLYVAWRTHEGLPVREPYCEEYLGKIHNESHIF